MRKVIDGKRNGATDVLMRSILKHAVPEWAEQRSFEKRVFDPRTKNKMKRRRTGAVVHELGQSVFKVQYQLQMVGREFTYSLTLYCVLEKSVRSLNQTMNGESNWNGSCRELDRIDGEPMEFEWMMNAGHTTLHILLEIQKLLKDLNCELGELKGRIIFMSMYNDIVWRFAKRTGMSC